MQPAMARGSLRRLEAASMVDPEEEAWLEEGPVRRVDPAMPSSSMPHRRARAAVPRVSDPGQRDFL